MNIMKEKADNALLKAIIQILVSFFVLASLTFTSEMSVLIAMSIFLAISYLSFYISSLEKQIDFLLIMSFNANTEIEKLKHVKTSKGVHKETSEE